ncbi:MAG: alkaline phosphatase [Flavobacteriales bacterium]|nr:alkaline phosphatase [Flavobacteriales bacterium]
MKNIRIAIIALAAIIMASCAPEKKEPHPQNVIYLIGDGMGFGAVTSLLLTEDSLTGFEKAPVIGLSETQSANSHVTDSPAGGTALACGTRVKNGVVGIHPVDSTHLTSILEKAKTWGKKTGIVVNTTLTEATPAAFYANVEKRSMGFEIARQFTESDVDVAIGAGLSAFINRPDSLDLTATLIEKGYDVYLDWKSVLNTTSEKYVGILSMGDVHRRNKPTTIKPGAAAGDEVCLAAKLAADAADEADTTIFSEPQLYLEKATAKALTALEKNAPNGFFLMIESAIIDGYGHNNDSEGMIEEMQEFDRTLQMLIEYVNSHPSTLLVVTADHETGGTGIGYKSHAVGEKAPVSLTFSTKGHTGTVVPIFAYGEGAEKFSGVMKNTDLPAKIEALIK